MENFIGNLTHPPPYVKNPGFPGLVESPPMASLNRRPDMAVKGRKMLENGDIVGIYRWEIYVGVWPWRDHNDYEWLYGYWDYNGLCQ